MRSGRPGSDSNEAVAIAPRGGGQAEALMEAAWSGGRLSRGQQEAHTDTDRCRAGGADDRVSVERRHSSTGKQGPVHEALCKAEKASTG